MKVKCNDNSIWDYKLRKIVFFTHKYKIQLFGTPTTDTNKINNITIKESGHVSQDELYTTRTSINFVYCLNDKNDEYEINVAVKDR